MEKQNLTKKYIFEAYKSLLTTKKYEDISVCDICKRAGVSRMSFYRNFESKEDLTIKGFDSITQKIQKEVNQKNNVNVYNVVRECFAIFKDYKDIIGSLKHTEIFQSIIAKSTTDLQEKFNIDYINKSARYAPLFYISAVYFVIINWLKCGAVETPDEMARLVTPLINPHIFNSDCIFKPEK